MKINKKSQITLKTVSFTFWQTKISGLKLENVTIFGIERGHLEAMQSFTFSFTAAVPENLKCLVAKSLT